METRTYPEFSTNYPLLLTTFMKRPVSIYPNEIGVVYRNQVTGEYFRFTWMEWYKRTCALANVLKNKLGLKPGQPGQPGDRIATMSLNTHRHLEIYYAVPCIGNTLHPINVRLSQDHIVFTVNHAEDKVIFVDDQLLPLLEAIWDQIADKVEKVVYMSDKPGLPETKIENMLEYEALLAAESDEFDWPYLHEDTPATLCYTTGTTGLPKGASFTHRALYLMTLHVNVWGNFNNTPKYDKINRREGENAVPMITTPLFHIHAWGAPYAHIFAARKVVLPGMFTVDGFCELVQTEKVTSVGVVPTIVAMLLAAFPVLANEKPILAVMQVEDKTGKFKRGDLEGGTDYLRAKLVESGRYQVVDKTRQGEKRALVAKNLRRESHSPCFPERGRGRP